VRASVTPFISPVRRQTLLYSFHYPTPRPVSDMVQDDWTEGKKEGIKLRIVVRCGI